MTRLNRLNDAKEADDREKYSKLHAVMQLGGLQQQHQHQQSGVAYNIFQGEGDYLNHWAPNSPPPGILFLIHEQGGRLKMESVCKIWIFFEEVPKNLISLHTFVIFPRGETAPQFYRKGDVPLSFCAHSPSSAANSYLQLFNPAGDTQLLNTYLPEPGPLAYFLCFKC